MIGIGWHVRRPIAKISTDIDGLQWRGKIEQIKQTNKKKITLHAQNIIICKHAKLPNVIFFSPFQLNHSAWTKVRKEFKMRVCRRREMHMHTNARVFNQPSFGCTHEASQTERQLSSHQFPSQLVNQFSVIQSSKQTMYPSIPPVDQTVTVSNKPSIPPIRHTARDTGSNFGGFSYSHNQQPWDIERINHYTGFYQICEGEKSGRHL